MVCCLIKQTGNFAFYLHIIKWEQRKSYNTQGQTLSWNLELEQSHDSKFCRWSWWFVLFKDAFSVSDYTECARRKAQYSGRSQYLPIPSKNCICTCVLLRKVSVIELFHCTVPKLLVRKRYCVLFLTPVFIVQLTKLVQFVKWDWLGKFVFLVLVPYTCRAFNNLKNS
jgi:hypothetical protein